jgi:hypothetical protein
MSERAHAPVTYDPIEQSCEVQGDEKQYELLEEGGEHLEAFDRDGSLCDGSGKWGGSECSKQDRVCTRMDSILTWGILKLRGGMGVGGQQSRSPRTSFGGAGAGAGWGDVQQREQREQWAVGHGSSTRHLDACNQFSVQFCTI